MILSKRQDMLDKIRKLMNMANHAQSNEQEAETAMRQANKLMAEYGIFEAECDLSAIEADLMEFGEELASPDGKPLKNGKVYRNVPHFASILAIGVARFTETITVLKNTSNGTMFSFRGELGDVQLAIWLLTTLIQSIQKTQKTSGWTRRGEASQFKNAAACSLQKRLKLLAAERKAIYERAQQQSNSKALVVVNLKAQKVSELWGDQKTRKINTGSSSSCASQAGQAAGSSMSIPTHRPLTGTSSRLLTH